MKVRDLIAWLSQRDPDEQISLAGSELGTLAYPDPPDEIAPDDGFTEPSKDPR